MPFMPLLPPLKSKTPVNTSNSTPAVKALGEVSGKSSKKLHRAHLRSPLLIVGAIFCLIVLLGAVVRDIHPAHSSTAPLLTSHSADLPAVFHLLGGSDRTTNADIDISLATTQSISVEPAFMGYYAAHSGSATLGAPLTVSYQLPQGTVQFFANGALLLPPTSATSTTWDASHFGDISEDTFMDGQRDTSTGIVQLPLLYALLLAGSTAAIVPPGDASSTLTYRDLHAAVQTNMLISPPNSQPNSQPNSLIRAEQDDFSEFIAEGHINGVPVGHSIPEDVWEYINRPDISPDGWPDDVGVPLSEPLPFTAIEQGANHRMEAQVFAHTVLLVDFDADNQQDQPAIQRLATGVAYLETFTPPTPVVHAGASIWGNSPWANTPVLATPNDGSTTTNNNPLLLIGANFPLRLQGPYQWVKGVLWYAISWSDQHSVNTGWVAATGITFTPPTPGSAIWSSFDALSPDLAAYLSSHGSHVSAVVFDETRQQYYLYNVPKRFYMASSVKVPIMLALLQQLEQQHRGPNASEMSLLTTMIENSNNDSAQALFDEIGGAPALDGFMRSLGIGNFSAFPDAWGYSVISPLAMVQLLTKLHDGTILTASDRGLALNLMENIESDEQVGVGTTAPAGATVAMKDGWVPGPDNRWVMNTSGIVTLGQETYIIAVYTQEDTSLQQGWDITQHICAAVGQALT